MILIMHTHNCVIYIIVNIWNIFLINYNIKFEYVQTLISYFVTILL